MTDLTYRAARAENPTEPLSHGHHATWSGTAQQYADTTAERLRNIRPDTRDSDLVVHVWPTRADEHYRLPVPADAAEFRYPVSAPSTHWGRSWAATPIEDECLCPQAPCGLVDTLTVDQDCTEHGVRHSKTRRQAHRADQCPATALLAARTGQEG